MKTMESGIINSKALAFNNMVTCVYLLAIILMLHFTENLYNVGKVRTTTVGIVLSVAEILKFLKYYLIQDKYGKKADAKKFKINNFFQGLYTIASMIGVFYITAVLFGAPVLSSQFETFSFAIIMTILTVLPCCLYLGADSIFTLFTSLTSFEGSNIYYNFLLNIRLTVFGSWLGAVLIPLDWNKPYQEWPVPCCLGAIIGCFVSHITLLALYLFSVPAKKTGKFCL